jgi:hypothetical protein
LAKDTSVPVPVALPSLPKVRGAAPAATVPMEIVRHTAAANADIFFITLFFTFLSSLHKI